VKTLRTAKKTLRTAKKHYALQKPLRTAKTITHCKKHYSLQKTLRTVKTLRTAENIRTAKKHYELQKNTTHCNQKKCLKERLNSGIKESIKLEKNVRKSQEKRSVDVRASISNQFR